MIMSLFAVVGPFLHEYLSSWNLFQPFKFRYYERSFILLSFAFISIWAIIGRPYIFWIFSRIVIIQVSFSWVYNLLGTWSETINRL